jgi:hypothetical protein
MRYMALLKGNRDSESRAPSKEEVAQMGQYVGAAMKEGWLVATEGLRPSANATRIQVSAGKPTVIDGPFTESKELVASYAILQVQSKQEAIERTRQFLELIGGGEIDLWQLYEEADFV